MSEEENLNFRAEVHGLLEKYRFKITNEEAYASLGLINHALANEITKPLDGPNDRS